MKKLNKKGFTLIELMIVIAIIAILAAILVPNFVKARAQGQLTACKSNLKNIGTAMEMYASDHNGRYVTGTDLSGSDLTEQGYMKVVPTCPVTNGSQYTYSATANPDYYYLRCDCGAHQQAGMKSKSYPQFDSIMGLVAPGSDDSTSMATYQVGFSNL
jgi:prepilin-type N-terminal cleavage/methylation domain-containing protein